MQLKATHENFGYWKGYILEHFKLFIIIINLATLVWKYFYKSFH